MPLLRISYYKLKKLAPRLERGERRARRKRYLSVDELNRRRVDVRLVYDGSPSIEEKALAVRSSKVPEG